MLIRIEDIDYAVALKWSKKKPKSSPYVTVSGDSTSLLEASYGWGDNADHSNPSLAAICTEIENDGLFVAQSDDLKTYWTCIIVGGMVVHDSDRVFTDIDHLVLYIDNEGDASDLHVSLNKPLISAGINQTVSMPPSVDSFVLKSNKNKLNIKAIVVFVGVSLLLGCSYYGYGLYQESKILEAQRIAQNHIAEQERLKTESDNKKITEHGLKSAMSALYILSGLSVNYYGWILIRSTVDIVSNSITMTFSNKGGVSDYILNRLPDYISNKELIFNNGRSEVSISGDVVIDVNSFKRESGKMYLVDKTFNYSNVSGNIIDFSSLPSTGEGSVRWKTRVNSKRKLINVINFTGKENGFEFTSLTREGNEFSLSGNFYVK